MIFNVAKLLTTVALGCSFKISLKAFFCKKTKFYQVLSNLHRSKTLNHKVNVDKKNCDKGQPWFWYQNTVWHASALKLHNLIMLLSFFVALLFSLHNRPVDEVCNRADIIFILINNNYYKNFQDSNLIIIINGDFNFSNIDWINKLYIIWQF